MSAPQRSVAKPRRDCERCPVDARDSITHLLLHAAGCETTDGKFGAGAGHDLWRKHNHRIQRLRINATRRVYAVFDAGIGYIQCMPVPPVAVYCEAQSVETWAALTTVLTPERVGRLRAAGYADPGRAPNYSKSYPFEKFKDAAIASEILTILHEVYGYTGATKLETTTE